MKKYLRSTILFPWLLIFLHSVVIGQSTETQLLAYSYNGTGKPGASGREFMQVMKRLEVQKALLDVAAAPRTSTFFSEALKGIGVTPDDLQNLRLIRRDGDLYVLRFSLYTKSDLDKIRAVAEVEGASLAAALLARRSEIQEILARNPQSGVDSKTMAYFILGCVSLDWDGLNLAEKRGYMAAPPKGIYIPEAHEIGGGGSNRGIYWGSHNYHESIAHTSFGDHYSLPRYALPDLLSSPKSVPREMNAPELLKSKLFDAAIALIPHCGLDYREL